jgi:hypothetical protein
MQILKIERTIQVGEEDVLAVVTALGDVVWRSRKNESRSPRHGIEWKSADHVLKENASVPFCPHTRSAAATVMTPASTPRPTSI